MNWPKTLIEKLIENPEMVKIYILPGLLFLLDFVLRASLGAQLTDAGADMALLAVATFVTVLVEGLDNQRIYVPVSAVFIMIFLVPWIICVKISTLESSAVPFLLNLIDSRLVLSWLIGIVAFVLSGIIAHTIVQRVTKPKPSRKLNK